MNLASEINAVPLARLSSLEVSRRARQKDRREAKVDCRLELDYLSIHKQTYDVLHFSLSLSASQRLNLMAQSTVDVLHFTATGEV